MTQTIKLHAEADTKNPRRVIASSGERTDKLTWICEEESGCNLKYLRFDPMGLKARYADAVVPLNLDHKTWDIPIGTAQLFHHQGQLKADLNFHEETEESRLVAKLWDMGVYRASSIEVFPDFENYTVDEVELLFHEGVVLGLAVTAYPADPGALVTQNFGTQIIQLENQLVEVLQMGSKKAEPVLVEETITEAGIPEGSGDGVVAQASTIQDILAQAQAQAQQIEQLQAQVEDQDEERFVALANRIETLEVGIDQLAEAVGIMQNSIQQSINFLSAQVARMDGEPVVTQAVPNAPMYGSNVISAPVEAFQQHLNPPQKVTQQTPSLVQGLGKSDANMTKQERILEKAKKRQAAIHASNGLK